MAKRTIDMTVGNPTKHLLTFSIPLILTNIGQQLYAIVDAAIVGRGIGVQALAAVGATDWSYWLVLWTISGLTQAFSTFVSRYFGQKNYKEMNKTIAMSVILCAVIGTTFTVAGLLAAKPLLMMLNTPTDILDSAVTYLITMIMGTVIVMAYNMAASILRALGDGKTPLMAMVFAALLNIGLDCVFVFLFHWGIFGAALASVLAQLVSFLYCLVSLSRIDYIKLDKKIWKSHWEPVKNMLLFGLPVAIQYIIVTMGGIVLQSSINLQGSVFIAGYTATNKVYGLLASSAVSIGLACSTYLAQNYGAHKYDRVKQGVTTAVKIVLVMYAVIAGFTLAFREQILCVFLDITEEGGAEALKLGVHYLIITACCLILSYLLQVFRNALQAIGVSKWSMVSGIAEFFARVIMAKFVIHWMGSEALFYSEPVAWLGALLGVMLPYFYHSKKLLVET